MNLIKPFLFCLALISSTTFAEDCVVPEVPSLPDGATASLQEMLDASSAAIEGAEKVEKQYNTLSDMGIV